MYHYFNHFHGFQIEIVLYENTIRTIYKFSHYYHTVWSILHSLNRTLRVISIVGIGWILVAAPLDNLSNFDNYMTDDGTYTVRTKYEDFVMLVDGKIRPSNSPPPREGILIVRRLDKTWNDMDPEWTPVCAYNFNDEDQACKDLGFHNGAVGFHSTNVEAVNNGEWEVRDGWGRQFKDGKYPYSEIHTESFTGVTGLFYKDIPRRKIFINRLPK